MLAFEVLPIPVTIGVVSDTHIVSSTRGLPNALLTSLHDCDCIVHAGDICVRMVLDQLGEIAPVFAVYGNNDDADLRRTLPLEMRFSIGRLRIGLMHGHGSRSVARVHVLEHLRGEVDCAVYGHSHRAEVETRDRLLMVNPGSPTDRRWGRIPSFAIITVDTTIDARLVTLN